MILVLPWMAIWLGKAVIQGHAPAAGHVRKDAIEDAVAVFILVEAAIDELSQKSATL